jgi:hypothetical protein
MDGPIPQDTPDTTTISFVDLTELVRLSPCDSVPQTARATQALTGDTTYENEIHDCQRLVFSGEGQLSFGPLVGIFPIDAAMADPDTAFRQGRVVASIFNWGSREDSEVGRTPYEQLGLQGEWHCLWLRNEARGTWSAAITTAESAPCGDEQNTERPDWGALSVAEIRHAAAPGGAPGSSVYPRTARWGWDSVNAAHYIGIKCGDAWCAVGARGFQKRERDVLTGPIERTIPGWYDEQHLAVTESVPGGPARLRPGPWATIYPAPGLRASSDADFKARMRFVATIVLMPGSSDATALDRYRYKFNATGPDTVGIWLHVQPDESVRVEFRNQITAPATSKNTQRMMQTLHAAEGAVRWRWHRTDETGWIWCGACCDIGSPF